MASIALKKPKMKGIILAGGTATRLFPLTATTSKQLLPVYDRQMIFYPLNTLIKAGITEILVIVSPDHSGQFLNLLGSLFKKYGIKLYFEVQKIPAGLPEAFVLGENFIGEDNVTLILGDNIFEEDFSTAIKDFRSGGQVFVKKVPDPERYGVAVFDQFGQVTQIEEKPKEWISNYAIAGLYVFDNQVVKAAMELNPSERGELEIVDLHKYYLNRDELRVTPFEGEWLDAGTFDSLLEAGRIVKEKQMTRNFHPIIEDAVIEFNTELKERSKRILQRRNDDSVRMGKITHNHSEEGNDYPQIIRFSGPNNDIWIPVRWVTFWVVSAILLTAWYFYLNS